MAGREGLFDDAGWDVKVPPCEYEWCKYESVEYVDGNLHTKYMCNGNCDSAELDIESFKRGKEIGIALMQKKIIERLSDESMKKIVCEIAERILQEGVEE